MSADADHEVIDSPGALFRHLYEEHGVEEARDLDPETAPLQFWLRRHTELELAQGEARPRRDPPPPARPAGGPAGRTRDGRRQHAGFGDPLVEAMARALAGRGYDETVVRSAIRSFTANGRGPSGEAAVRSALVEPMLQAAAERLLGAPRSTRPADHRPPDAAGPPRAAERPPPAPAAPARPPDPAPPPPPRREETVRPEAAWAVLWADLADSGRRPGDRAGTAGDDGDDLMAVANAVQARRRVRLLRR